MVKTTKVLGILLASTFVLPCVGADDLYDDEAMLSDFYGDELTVSIATGASQPIHKAPAVASVITAEEMLRTGVRNIDEALERVPGLHVARDSIGYNPIYTFRGIYSGLNPQVLMLINGVPITNLYQGDRNIVWGGMPVEAISRIEVIRGPGSALYGADAFAGVINVVLKQGREIDGAQAGVRIGSFDTQEYWYVNGGQNNDLEWMFALEYSDSDGSDEVIEQDLQSQLDQGIVALLGSAFATNASLAPGSVNKGKELLDIRLNLTWKDVVFNIGLQDRESQNYAGLAQALDPTNLYASTRWNADLSYENNTWFDSWELKVQGSFLHTTQEVEESLVLFPSGSTGPTPLPVNPFALPNPVTNPLITYPAGVIGNPEVYETHTRLKISGRYSGFAGHDITVGSGYYFGDIYKTEEEKNYQLVVVPGVAGGSDSLLLTPLGQLQDVSDTADVFLPEGSRENYYVFAQDVWQLSNDWELTAGIRYDDYSDFGSTVNPRLALVWSTSNNLTTKFLYGSAFRAPSFGETSISSNPSFLGNEDLDPETLDSYEVAFDYRPSAEWALAMNFFYYSWEDIIQFVPEGVGISRAQNVGEQSGYGTEFEFTWRPSSQFDLLGNIALQTSEDKNADADAANAPEKQLYLQANWRPIQDWQLSVQGNWVMDRNRASNDTRSDIDDYVLIDLTLRKTNVIGGLDAAIIVSNLFDKEAYEPSRAASDTGLAAIPGDLPLQGRTIVGEVRYSF